VRRWSVLAFEQIDENSRDEGHQRETDQNDRLLRPDLSNRLLDPLKRQPRSSRNPPSRPTLHLTGMVGVTANVQDAIEAEFERRINEGYVQ